jgi:hypothetical protein
VDGIPDAHTHLTGRESADQIHQILECMDFCGVEKAFVFAPMLNVGAHQITSDSLDDIRTHNGYCADVCSKASERLLGFCHPDPNARPRRRRPRPRSGPRDREAERSYTSWACGAPGSWSRPAGMRTTSRSSSCVGPWPRSGCTRSFTRACSLAPRHSLPADVSTRAKQRLKVSPARANARSRRCPDEAGGVDFFPQDGSGGTARRSVRNYSLGSRALVWQRSGWGKRGCRWHEGVPMGWPTGEGRSTIGIREECSLLSPFRDGGRVRRIGGRG